MPDYQSYSGPPDRTELYSVLELLLFSDLNTGWTHAACCRLTFLCEEIGGKKGKIVLSDVYHPVCSEVRRKSKRTSAHLVELNTLHRFNHVKGPFYKLGTSYSLYYLVMC